jgi:LPXTG-motif cell wall-anchored protein
MGSEGGFFTGKKLAVGAIALFGLIVLGVALFVLRRKKKEIQW